MYQHDPDRAPDSDFVSGSLAHLVCGNSGRLLDHRRTPVCVVGVHPDQALFELAVMAFEVRRRAVATPGGCGSRPSPIPCRRTRLAR